MATSFKSTVARTRKRLTNHVIYVIGEIGPVEVTTDDSVAQQFVFDALLDYTIHNVGEENQIMAVHTYGNAPVKVVELP